MTDGPRAGRGWADFDWTRERYEDLIRRIVPGYETQDALVASAVREVVGPGSVVLDLGAGTGTLSRVILEASVEVRVVAMDVSPVMVETCRESLAEFGDRVEFMLADFSDPEIDLGRGYDAVVSRLAIHHLTDEEKPALFRRVHAALLSAGLFVDCDLIRGETATEDAAMLTDWRRYMVGRGDDPTEWEEWLVGEGDHPSRVGDHAIWLREAGFDRVEVPWRQGGFAVMQARRRP